MTAVEAMRLVAEDLALEGDPARTSRPSSLPGWSRRHRSTGRPLTPTSLWLVRLRGLKKPGSARAVAHGVHQPPSAAFGDVAFTEGDEHVDR